LIEAVALDEQEKSWLRVLLFDATSCARVACSSTEAGATSGSTQRPSCAMAESYGVVDLGVGKCWSFADKTVAVRYAAGRHAATGNVVEVVRWTDAGSEAHLVLTPDAPAAGLPPVER
jgi:hypothetical protein